VNEKSEFPYTFKNMKAHDAEPRFGPDTKAEAFRNENGDWVISFDEAKPAEGYIVHDYKLVIKDENEKKIFSGNFINDYYIIDEDKTADFVLGADTLEKGKKYTLVIKAESAYHYHSVPIELTFTAE
nr:hypothetical protein [Clostridiales bacterium]